MVRRLHADVYNSYTLRQGAEIFYQQSANRHLTNSQGGALLTPTHDRFAYPRLAKMRVHHIYIY